MIRRVKVLHNINDGIKHTTIRIVGEGVESKVCTITEAIQVAESLGVDVVEVNPNVSPVICKLIRYDKFLYEEKKRLRDIKKKNREQQVEVKEIRLTPTTDTHDLNFKIKHSINFLEDGDKVKVVMKFSGREIVHKEKGEKLMLEFALKLEDYGYPETFPKLEGKRMFMILKPKK
jgi:translation initiation factor IF-3